jgi:energy-coupling factor transport system permease protein
MTNDFELLRNITIGQYIPGQSLLHRLDPRAKLMATAILAASFSASRSLIAICLLLCFILALVRLAGISPLYALRSVIPSLGFLAALFIFQLLYTGWRDINGYVYLEWGWLRLTRYSIHLILLSALRFVSYLVLLSLLTLTTTSSHLMHAIEIMLSPLKRLRVPVHEFALMNMIAFRFVPTLAAELDQVTKAQASRGADVGRQPFWRPDKVFRSRFPLIVPLFINALRRAEELILAMESRCYMGGAQRSKFVQLRWGKIDTLALLGAIVVYLLVRMTMWLPIHSFVPGL